MIRQKIYEIIEKCITDKDAPEINDEITLRELGFDSLDIVEITILIEKEFNITISDEEEEKYMQLQTIGGICDFILDKYA